MSSSRLLEELCSIFPSPNKVPESTNLRDEAESSLIKSTVDAVFFDLSSWLLDGAASKTGKMSRERLLHLFCEKISQLWSTRKRCKMIVVISERNDLLPVWVQSEKQQTDAETRLEMPEDPLPYLWDDSNLGGLRGFQSWVKTRQGKLDCCRTLLSDLFHHLTRDLSKKIVPFENKHLLIDCDIPGETFIFKKDALKPERWWDQKNSGATGDTFLSLKRHVQELESRKNEGVFGVRTYEMISNDPEWGIMTIHMTFLSQGQKFEGPPFVGIVPRQSWNRTSRFLWRHEEKTVFSADSWYSLLRVSFHHFYEPWSHILFLFMFRNNSLLDGTTLKSMDLKFMVKSLSEWHKKRIISSEKKRPLGDRESNHLGGFLFINPKTETLAFDGDGFLSFIHHLLLPSETIKSRDEMQKIPEEFWADLAENDRRKVLESLVKDLKESANIINLQSDCEGGNPLSHMKDVDVKTRREMAKKITEWLPEEDVPAISLKLGFNKKQRKDFIDRYNFRLTDKTIDAFCKNMVDSEGKDIDEIVSSTFPRDNPRLHSLGQFFSISYAPLFRHRPLKMKNRIVMAFRQTFWQTIYRTIGDHPYFIEKKWYESKQWGWNLKNGMEKNTKAKQIGITFYKDLDVLRSENKEMDKKCYVWDNLFNPGSLPHDLNHSFTLEREIQQSPVVCGVRLKNQDFFSYDTDIDDLKGLKTDTKVTMKGYFTREMWNCYVKKIVPAHLSKTIEFPIRKILGASFDFSLDSITGKVPLVYSIAFRLLSEMQNLTRNDQVPYHAQVWLREFLQRVDLFSQSRKGIDAMISKLIINDRFKILVKEGKWGLLLDYIAEYSAQSTFESKEDGVVRSLFFLDHNNTTWNMVLEQKKSFELDTRITKLAGGNEIRMMDVHCPIDGKIYNVIRFQHLEDSTPQNMIDKIVSDKSFKSIKRSLSCLIETEWEDRWHTNGHSRNWKVIITTVKGPSFDPLENLYTASVGSKSGFIPVKNTIQIQRLLKSLILQNDICHIFSDTRSTQRNGPTFYYFFEIQSDNIAHDIVFGSKKLSPIPGVLYRVDTKENALGVAFHSPIWKGTKACVSALQKMGLSYISVTCLSINDPLFFA